MKSERKPGKIANFVNSILKKKIEKCKFVNEPRRQSVLLAGGGRVIALAKPQASLRRIRIFKKQGARSGRHGSLKRSCCNFWHRYSV
jgi:hypothetical protein